MKKYEKLTYGIGSLGNNLIYGFMATYLVAFYTDYFGVATATVGVLLFIARVWDGFNDPIMGMIVDNTKSKYGRFRPYLLYVPFIMGIFTALTFWGPSLDGALKIFWIYFTYIGWGMAFTAMDIPYWALSAAITQDPEDRNDVVMASRTIATVGFFIAVVAGKPIIDLLGNDLFAWRVTGIAIALLGIGFTLITFFTVKERVVHSGKDKQTFKKMWQQLQVNKPLRLILMGLFVIEAGNAIKMVLPFYYMKYNMGAESLMAVFLGVYALFTILGSIISPFVSNRLGKKNTVLYSIVGVILSGFGLYFSGYDQFSLVILFNAIFALAFGLANIALMSMLADTVEYGEWKTGKRAEGMVFSLNIFKTKMASALGGLVGAFTLDIFGFVANTNQQQQVLDGIHFSFSLLPALIGLIAIIPFMKYALTEDRYRQILGELKQRKLEQQRSAQ